MGYAWLTRLPKVELHVHMEDAIPTTPYGRGLLVCVNTDNPRIFHNSLADEFWQLRAHLGISHADVRRLILNGVKASWLPDDGKQELMEQFSHDSVWNEEANA